MTSNLLRLLLFQFFAAQKGNTFMKEALLSGIAVRAGIWAVALVLTIGTPMPLVAALGGDATSVEADQTRLQATMRSMQAESYSVQELHTASGIVVREYISAEGKVFGIAWRGPWPPDLHQLLGTYFESYARALQSQQIRGGRRPVRVELPGLVVHAAGHARSFTGQAYVPGMLPRGVAAEAIQ